MTLSAKHFHEKVKGRTLDRAELHVGQTSLAGWSRIGGAAETTRTTASASAESGDHCRVCCSISTAASTAGSNGDFAEYDLDCDSG